MPLEKQFPSDSPNTNTLIHIDAYNHRRRKSEKPAMDESLGEIVSLDESKRKKTIEEIQKKIQNSQKITPTLIFLTNETRMRFCEWLSERGIHILPLNIKKISFSITETANGSPYYQVFYEQQHNNCRKEETKIIELDNSGNPQQIY